MKPMPKTEAWEAYGDVGGRDQPDVFVNWPSQVVAYLDGGVIGEDPVANLRIGGVRFRRPLGQLRLMCEAAIEQLDAVAEHYRETVEDER